MSKKEQRLRYNHYFFVAVDREEIGAFITNPRRTPTSCIVSNAYKHSRDIFKLHHTSLPKVTCVFYKSPVVNPATNSHAVNSPRMHVIQIQNYNLDTGSFQKHLVGGIYRSQWL